jgi:hypothetical protein
MQRKTSLLIVAITVCFSLSAQSSGMYFGSSIFPITNAHDSAVLFSNELKVWQTVCDSGTISVYDNPSIDIEFRVRMTRYQAEYIFKDSTISDNNSSIYQMITMHNRSLDTFYLMCCNTMISKTYYPRQHYHFPRPPFTGITCLGFIPLSEYERVVGREELQKADAVFTKSICEQIGGISKNDTISRLVRFTIDSNEYLPQAPYRNILSQFEAGLFMGKLRTYSTSEMKYAMTKREMENQFVEWDSTTLAEDPNNPGVFIIAPIKYQARLQSILIMEEWIPFIPGILSDNIYGWPPNPYRGYARKVTAYGLLLDSGNILWVKASDFENYLRQQNFNFCPYEECFRAERFTSFGIRFDN